MYKKTCAALLIALASLTIGQGKLSEDGPQTNYYLLHEDCANEMNEHIGLELYASIVYLNMAAYFDRPSVALQGYAKFFRDQSQEEYNHAGAFIDYLNKRNSTVSRISIEESPKSEWLSPAEALTDAIKLEKHVYAKIQHIHDAADQRCLDSHLTDFLEGTFFTEQVDSIRDLQVLLTKLRRSGSSDRTIEYLEDKRLASSHKEL